MSDTQTIDVPANVSDPQIPGGAPPVAADTPTESAPVITTTDGDEPPADGDEPAKTPASVQKSINRLTRQRAEAERRAMRAEARAEALESIRSQPPTQAPPKSAELKPTDFATYEEFTRAQARQEANATVEERLRAADKDYSERRSAESAQQKKQSFIKEASVQAKADGIDFEDAWEELTTAPRLSAAVADYLFEAENKARLANYLATNPDELARLSDLTPREADRDMAKLDARLGAKPSPKRSSAPPPPPTLGGGGVAPTSIERMPHGDLRKLVAGWAKK